MAKGPKFKYWIEEDGRYVARIPVPLAERSLHRDLAIQAELEDMSLNKYIEEALARAE